MKMFGVLYCSYVYNNNTILFNTLLYYNIIFCNSFYVPITINAYFIKLFYSSRSYFFFKYSDSCQSLYDMISLITS